MTISELHMKNYLHYLMEEERSEATLEKYQRDVKGFLEYLNSPPYYGEIQKEVVIAYKHYLIEHYAVNSVNSMLAAVNGFLGFLELDQYKVKKIRIQRKIFVSEEKELTKEEYMRLLKAAKEKNSERLYLIIQTICATGIRISELNYFTVQAVKRGKIQVYCKGKERIVFIPKQLRKKLLYFVKRQGIEDGCIFITRGNKPVNRSNIWKDMKQLCERAGVLADKVFPHNLRHLFARTYYKLEKDITKLADILGHSSIETTRIYIMSSGKEHEKQIGCLGLVG